MTDDCRQVPPDPLSADSLRTQVGRICRLADHLSAFESDVLWERPDSIRLRLESAA